jgi:hypothetical protein
MTTTPSREPNGSVVRPEPTPALFALLKCPSCGRDPAIVFPLIRDHKTVDAAPLVCLGCCLRVRNRSNRTAVMDRTSLPLPVAEDLPDRAGPVSPPGPVCH